MKARWTGGIRLHRWQHFIEALAITANKRKQAEVYCFAADILSLPTFATAGRRKSREPLAVIYWDRIPTEE